MARSEGSKEELEARRKQAVRLLNRTDMDISKVTEVERVTTRRCTRWMRRRATSSGLRNRFSGHLVASGGQGHRLRRE